MGEVLDSGVWDGKGWIDISRPLTPQTPVWPGDRSLEFRHRHDGEILITRVTTTCHVGTHVDAPLHVTSDGVAVHEIPLGHFIGPTEVIRLPKGCVAARPVDLPVGWIPRFPKVLLRSDSHPIDTPIRDGFVGASVELVGWLADHGVSTMGIDTPSVDVFASVDLEVHYALCDRGMAWIEGLDLSGVETGAYLMVALPAPLRGVEAAPVRALLKRLE